MYSYHSLGNPRSLGQIHLVSKRIPFELRTKRINMCNWDAELHNLLCLVCFNVTDKSFVVRVSFRSIYHLFHLGFNMEVQLFNKVTFSFRAIYKCLIIFSNLLRILISTPLSSPENKNARTFVNIFLAMKTGKSLL